MAVTLNIPSQVRTFANLAAFPASGSLKTIYIAEDTNKTYRWTGSVYVEISASAATGLTVGTTPIASGTVGRVLFEGTGNVLQESANLFWDNTNVRLGIGTSTPTNPLQLLSAANSGYFVKVQNTNGGALSSAGYEMQSNTAYGSLFANPSTYAPFGVLGPSQIGFYTSNTFAIAIDSGSADFRIGLGSGGPTERFRITNGGNVLINTTTDAGFKLDVNGTARLAGNLTFTTGDRFLQYGTGSGTFFIGRDAAAVYVGYNFGTQPIHIGSLNSGNILFRSTGNVCLDQASSKLLIGTTTDDGFKLDVNGTARVSGNTTVSLNQNNTTLLAISNTTAGTLSNAALQLISDTSAGQAQVFKYSSTRTAYKTLAANDFGHYNATAGDISFLNDVATGRIKFATGGVSTPQMTLFPTGNLGINTTTDAGFRLDVNGTARVSAKLTVNNDIISSRDGNLVGRVDVSNTTSGASSLATFVATSSAGSLWVGKYSATTTANKITLPNDSFISNLTVGDLAISNEVATGRIKFAAGGSSTSHMIIKANGVINMAAIPTSAVGLSAGDLYNNLGVLMIV
jgi:hypothetical protein